MKNKGIRKSRVYIILAIVFIFSLIAIFALIKDTKVSNSARPISNSPTMNTKVAEKDDDTQQKTSAEPISGPLSDIIYGYEFKDNYKVSINYKNIVFDFNCNKYNEEEKVCNEGSGLMRYNDLVIPLYTYTEPDNNVLNFAVDFYIDMKDDYIFLTNNHVGFSSGSTSIYDNKGSLLGEVDNVVTGYILNEKQYNILYPSYSNHELTFYYIDHGIIKIGYIDLEDPTVINELEIVKGAILN